MSAIEQGLTLMVIGMGVVFVFLVLLVFVTTILSGFVRKYFPEKVKPAAAAKRPAAGSQDAEIAAAAAAAYAKR